MRHDLITGNGTFYKANLHCHTTFSDGALTPAQVKEAYMAKGYSIVAFTDHEVFLPHRELESDDFLPMYGFELGVDDVVESMKYRKVCHICFVALDKEMEVQPLWHRSKYQAGNNLKHMHEVVFDPAQEDYERTYTPECISEIMRTGREKNFFITYNHPVYSMENRDQYIHYHGMHAMEIYNNGSYQTGFWEYNPGVYDEILSAGERIFCIAADDNHNKVNDAFGGFIMIKADKLEYSCVADALRKGNFYASRGPEIQALWFDDETETIHVQCSDAARISCFCGARRERMIKAADCGKEFINEAVFPVEKDDRYVRITVVDKDMLTADTNAYFTDELRKLSGK